MMQSAARLAEAIRRMKEESTADLEGPSTVYVRTLPPELNP
jgi:hypothetical protein